jgi:hypothetical protein
MARSLEARNIVLPSPVSTPGALTVQMRQMRLATSGAVVSLDSRKTKCCIVMPVGRIVMPVGPGARPVFSFQAGAFYSEAVRLQLPVAWHGGHLGVWLGKAVRVIRPEVGGGQ